MATPQLLFGAAAIIPEAPLAVSGSIPPREQESTRGAVLPYNEARRLSTRTGHERSLSAAHNAAAKGAEYSKYLNLRRFSAHAAAGR